MKVIIYLFIALFACLPCMAQQNTWTGNTSNDWGTATNWSTGAVPQPSDQVIISQATNQPLINTSVEVYSVAIEANARLNVSATGQLLITGFNNSSSYPEIALYNHGTLSNSGSIIVGDDKSNIMGFWGFITDGTFDNKLDGVVRIVQAERYGFITYGTTVNDGKIIIATVGPGLQEGFQLAVTGTFTNAKGGEIEIGNTSGTGLVSGGNFINESKINIKVSKGVGLWCVGNTFANNSGGEINIESVTNTGLILGAGTFTNSSKIDISLIPVKVPDPNVQSIGMALETSSAQFTNNQGSQLTINNASQSSADIETVIGFINRGTGTLTNMGTIIMGDRAAIGSLAIDNNAGIFNNQGCHALLNVASNSRISGGSGFSNSGTIMENSSGNSDIGDNQGTIQNLNGGVFTVASGNAPLNLASPIPFVDLVSNLTASQTEICPNTVVTLNAGCSIAGALVNWNPGAPTVRPSGDDDVYVYRASCSIDDCISNESSVEVNIVCEPPFPSYLLLVPDAFSPNGDGINEQWNIRGMEKFDKVEFRVYNRWGELIFADKTGYQKPWEGTYKGKPVSAGPYPYIIDLQLEDKSHTIRGTVSILR